MGMHHIRPEFIQQAEDPSHSLQGEAPLFFDEMDEHSPLYEHSLQMVVLGLTVDAEDLHPEVPGVDPCRKLGRHFLCPAAAEIGQNDGNFGSVHFSYPLSNALITSFAQTSI